MKTLHYCLMLAVATMLMASCGYDDHLKTLPKETVAVVSIDLAGMVSKGDLHKLQEADFYKKMQEKMAEKDAESAKETDEFLKNPLNYGINFLKPVYLFAINHEPKPFVGVSIALGDAPMFETFILKVLNSDEKTYAIEKGTGYSYITTEDFTLAWGEKTLIASANKGFDAAVVQSIFAQKDKDQSVVDNAGFKSFYKKSKDISGWVSADFLTGLSDAINEVDTTAEYSEQAAKLRDQLKGSSFQFHMAFLEDEIHTEYLVDLPEEMKKHYDKEYLRKGTPEKMTKLVRGTDLLVFTAAIDLENYLKVIGDNPALTGELKETMNSYTAVIQQFIAPFDGDLLITVSDITVTEREITEQVPVEKTKDGELYASSEDYDPWDWEVEFRDTTYTKTETLPVFLAATTVNDESLGFILGMALGKDKPKAGKVTTSDVGGLKFYSTIKDKVLLVSNDKKTIDDIHAGTFNNNGNSIQSQGASDHGIYAYANLNLQDYPTNVVQNITTNSKASPQENAAMLKFFGMFEHVEIYNTANAAVVSFRLKQNGNNSLYTVIESIGNAAYAMGALE